MGPLEGKPAMRWCSFLWAISVAVVAWAGWLSPILAGDANNPDTAPCYEFTLGGLSPEQVKAASNIPGVLSVDTIGDHLRVRWRHWKPENLALPPSASGVPSAWIEKAPEGIYALLALKQNLGNTRWDHGGPATGRSATVVAPARTSIAFAFHFQNLSTGQVDTMKLHCYCEAEERRIQHEMLRDVVGTHVKVEKCGSGYAIVSREERGEFVVWQVSPQMFVRIDNLFDREMVGAYIDRLGSTTPKEFAIDSNQWIEDEIRWRILEMDKLYLLRREQPDLQCPSYSVCAQLQGTFPDVPVVIIRDIKLDCTQAQEWQFLRILRHWLWANRANLQYDDLSRGFKLRGRDRYDPDHPVELPAELRGPEAPPSADRKMAPATDPNLTGTAGTEQAPAPVVQPNLPSN